MNRGTDEIKVEQRLMPLGSKIKQFKPSKKKSIKKIIF